MTFSVGGQEHKEGITLTDREFFDSMKKGVPVSTSQPSIADLTDIWEELLKDYDRIIHIPMAKVLSGGYATAVTFSEEYGGRVLVVDGNRISVTQAALAQYARKLADAGMAASEIKEKLEATCMEAEIYITVESLESETGRTNQRSSRYGGRASACETGAEAAWRRNRGLWQNAGHKESEEDD